MARLRLAPARTAADTLGGLGTERRIRVGKRKKAKDKPEMRRQVRCLDFFSSMETAGGLSVSVAAAIFG